MTSVKDLYVRHLNKLLSEQSSKQSPIDEETLLEFDPNRGKAGRKIPLAQSFLDAHNQGLRGAEVNAHPRFASLPLPDQKRLSQYSRGRSFSPPSYVDQNDRDYQTGSDVARSPDVEADATIRRKARIRASKSRRSGSNNYVSEEILEQSPHNRETTEANILPPEIKKAELGKGAEYGGGANITKPKVNNSDGVSNPNAVQTESFRSTLANVVSGARQLGSDLQAAGRIAGDVMRGDPNTPVDLRDPKYTSNSSNSSGNLGTGNNQQLGSQSSNPNIPPSNPNNIPPQLPTMSSRISTAARNTRQVIGGLLRNVHQPPPPITGGRI